MFEGVLIEYDGQVKEVEEKIEEEVEMHKGVDHIDEMKVHYYRALLKVRFKQMFGNYQNFANLEEEYVELADYSWEECIADQMKRYGNKETAEKVCGSIKAKYGN